MHWLNIFSALFAFLAAIFWLLSTRVKTPEAFSVHGVSVGGDVSSVHSKDFAILANALKKQSRFSAWAAMCAGCAAVLQAVELLLV